MVQSERPQVKLEEEKRERFDSFFINKLWTQSIKKKSQLPLMGIDLVVLESCLYVPIC